MKRMMLICLCATMMLSLVGCGQPAPQEQLTAATTAAPTTSTTTVPTTTTTAPTTYDTSHLYDVYVNGVEVSWKEDARIAQTITPEVARSQDDPLIPLIAVVEEIGADVKWIEPTVAEITYRDAVYTLKSSENVLSKNGGDGTNYIAKPPGARTYCVKQVGEEVIIDCIAARWFLEQLGAVVRFYDEEATVTINTYLELHIPDEIVISEPDGVSTVIKPHGPTSVLYQTGDSDAEVIELSVLKIQSLNEHFESVTDFSALPDVTSTSTVTMTIGDHSYSFGLGCASQEDLNWFIDWIMDIDWLKGRW